MLLSIADTLLMSLELLRGSVKRSLAGRPGTKVWPRVRPRLEALEDRFLPTTCTWLYTGATPGDWNDPNNWSSGTVPGANDDAVFSSLALLGKSGSSGDCNMNIPNGTQVHSLTLDQYYTRTLTLQTPLVVQIDVSGPALTMKSGSISQPNGNNSWISVYGDMDWEGGTINSSSNLSSLEIATGTLTIQKPADRTIGDNINVAHGSSAVISDDCGGITFTNNAGISNAGTFEWQAGTAGLITTPSASATGVIENNGVFKTTGASTLGFRDFSCDLPFVNDTDSSLLLQSSYTLEFTKANPTSGVSVVMNYGNIDFVTNRTALQADKGYVQWGGDLSTASGTFFLYGGGNVKIHGGSVDPGGDVVGGSLATLASDGNVTMDGGTYYAVIDGTALRSSVWTSNSGSFTLGGDASLVVTTINIPDTGMPTGVYFTILEAGVGQKIIGDFSSFNFGEENYTTYPGTRPGYPRDYFLQS